MATAHHYPSDVICGAALGVILAYPISTCFLTFW